jgi:hypothetical protein
MAADAQVGGHARSQSKGLATVVTGTKKSFRSRACSSFSCTWFRWSARAGGIKKTKKRSSLRLWTDRCDTPDSETGRATQTLTWTPRE